MKNFIIDPAYLTNVTIHRQWSMFQGRDTLTEDELIKVLKGQDRCSSTHTEDHPEFAKLRNQLESEGYISVQRGWWNGDTVLKDFDLNGYGFCRGDQFPSGAAIAGHIKYTPSRRKTSKPRSTKPVTQAKIESS